MVADARMHEHMYTQDAQEAACVHVYISAAAQKCVHVYTSRNARQINSKLFFCISIGIFHYIMPLCVQNWRVLNFLFQDDKLYQWK